MTHDDDNLEELPQGLIDELRSADRPAALITSRVDREILGQAEAQFRRRRPVASRRYPAWAAVAATVLVAFFVLRVDAPAPPGVDGLYADHDGSGRVDIADVYYVARSNRQVSKADIDAFAMSVVSLSAGGGSP